MEIRFIALLSLFHLCQGHFGEQYRRWSKLPQLTFCNEDEGVCSLIDDCQYLIKPLEKDFGAKVTNIDLK